ncbi:MAG: type II toxin-antitoxin system RelE/ParE family toxin [Candidatus Aminicenantes bacterium]|nr:type II toxin-antitoxin system RelE/ParE family toxin [Candidatus Aminicenantes bacterium]
MRLIETSKLKRLRKKIKENHEKEALRLAVARIWEYPEEGKRLKGEFKELRSFSYTAKGQNRRLIYKLEEGTIVLLSFGPREGAYKK